MDQLVDAVSRALVVSCDADVARASQLQHTVQDVDSNCDFGRLTLVGLRAQRMTDNPFPAANIGFHQGTPVVPRRFLPTHAAIETRNPPGNRILDPLETDQKGIGIFSGRYSPSCIAASRPFGLSPVDL